MNSDATSSTMTIRDGATTTAAPLGRNGSSILRLDDRTRVGKLVGLQGFSDIVATGAAGGGKRQRKIDKIFLYNAVASFLASKHFNERLGTILPHLPTELVDDECDFYWSYEYRDGQQQGLEATRQLMEALDLAWDASHNHSSSHSSLGEDADASTGTSNASTVGTASSASWLRHNNRTTALRLREAAYYLNPFAIYGAFWSRVSKVVTSITAAFEIPYIAGVSTSAELEGVPYFARTSPNNEGDAQAAIVYYQHYMQMKKQRARHVAVLFIKDSWGINYHAALQKYANRVEGLTLHAFAYDPETLEQTLNNLKQSQYRYVFAIMHNWRDVLSVAYDKGIVGRPDYVWIAAEEKKWTGADFQLERGRQQEEDGQQGEYNLAQALHGIGTLNVYFEPAPAFEQALEEFSRNRTLQQEFIDIQAHQGIFENYTFPEYGPTGFANAIFDAVLALGVTACNASNGLPDRFTGAEFYEALKHTKFDGVSGRVQFDPDTGTRLAAHVRYSVEYIVLSDNRSDDSYYRFDSKIVAIMQQDNLTAYHPFLHHDNTTNSPQDLPPIDDVNLNLLPPGVHILGYALAGIVMVASIVCFIWTFLSRDIFVVRVSQPFFLCQLCVGTFLMALAIIPWSFPLSSSAYTGDIDINDYVDQDHYSDNHSNSNKGLDSACMSTLWLLFMGFSIAFASLASKTWRLNHLLSSGTAMRRTMVSVNDAMLPFYVSMGINMTMLLCITFVSPLRHERVHVGHYDSFGRSIESYASCQPVDSKFYYFAGTLAITDFLGVAVVTWEAYKGRNAPSDLSDASYLALSVMSLLETLIMGAPLLFVVGDNPTAFYLVGSSLISIGCITMLVLLFLPKFRRRKRRQQGSQAVMNAIQRASKNTRASARYSTENASSQPAEPTEPGRMKITRNRDCE